VRGIDGRRHNRQVVVPSSSTVQFFAVASIALLLIPGPAVLYIVAQSAEQGRTAGLASVAGIHIGTFVHIVAAAVGLSALILASAVAFNIVKFAGAAYLVYLGIRKLLERQPPGEAEPPRAPLRHVFLRGTVVNVLNPKTALFFLAFLPQFVDAGRGAVWSQVVVLGLVFLALGVVSDSAYALAGSAMGSLLRRRGKATRRISGTVYIALGGIAALAKRN
jgi:threonine/homoserine/homoserine lactone efflux protein